MQHHNNFPFVLFVYNPTEQGGCFEHCGNEIENFFKTSAARIIADPGEFFGILPEPERSFVHRKFSQTNNSPNEADQLLPLNVGFSTARAQNPQQRYLLQASCAYETQGWRWSGAIFSVDSIYQQQEAEIAAANYFLRLQDQLPDLFYYKDSQSRFLGGNKAWRNFHGFTNTEQWLGKTDKDSRRFSAKESEKLFNNEQSILQTGVVSRIREHVKNSDGSEFFMDSIKAPVFDEQQKIIGLVGLTRDITEQVKTEQALAQAKTAAEQAAIAKSSFLAVMSHEIRTPMNGVIGCASLLGETKLDAEQQQLVRTIQSCGEGLLVIINDILDYSKIEAGQIILDVHSFHLRELIEDTLELFAKSAADKSIELNYFIEPAVPLQLEGDSSRIRQVLINLIGNAIKFTDQGEVEITVSLEQKNNDENSCTILFSVRDTGIGISEEHRGNLFRVFTQADTSITRKYGGTGLGLAISKKIVQQMGGEIWFTSERQVGTRFFFSVQTIFEDKKHEQQTLDTGEFKNLHALIVDDNATNRKILAATLMQWGMRATAYASPENALETRSSGTISM